MNFSKNRLIWTAIAIVGLVGFILGIVGTAKPIGTSAASESVWKNIGDVLSSSALPDAIKTHIGVAAIGGLIALLIGVVAVGIASFGFKKESDSVTLLAIAGILAVTSLALGAAAVAMNSDLNDPIWLAQQFATKFNYIP